ncbi:MAG TPA: hypothetical protein VFS23_02760 [Vicinamibacterales bacterium]|nr:hypothetical protein [Vicinamibacterales bacterium]
MKRKEVFALLIYLTLAIATSFADLRMRAYPERGAGEFSAGVVANTEPAPGKYRVLAPFLNHYLATVTGAAPQSVWYVTRFLWILSAFLICHFYLRTWFPTEAAMAGVTMVAASLPLTFTNSWAHPDHFPELALFTLGAMTIARRNDLAFAVALALAALNRETSVFLVVLYLVAQPIDRPRAIRAAAFAAEWAVIYAGLRMLRGVQHYDYWQLGRNLTDLTIPLPDVWDPYYRAYAYFWVLLFGPMLLAAWQARTAPSFARRALTVVPLMVLVAFLFSNIIESRIFTPLFALVLPGFVAFFFDVEQRTSDVGPRTAEGGRRR